MRNNLRPPPTALPAFAVKQHWHARFHHDAANRWLRQQIPELFAGRANA